MFTVTQLVWSTLLLIGLFTTAYSVTITDCTGGTEPDAKLDFVKISDCPTTPGGACPLVQGTNASIEVDFTTVKPFETANVEIYGKIGVVKIPFPINPSQACGVYGFDCPVAVNEQKKLQIRLPIMKSYPRIGVTVQLNLVDQNKKPIICIEFPAKITSS